MSDISLHFSVLDLILMSPIFGWPGLLVGGALGALIWRRRRILGGALGAVAGNFALFFLRLAVL